MNAAELSARLENVAKWLENGCDPANAAKELRLMAAGLAPPPSDVEKPYVERLEQVNMTRRGNVRVGRYVGTEVGVLNVNCQPDSTSVKYQFWLEAAVKDSEKLFRAAMDKMLDKGGMSDEEALSLFKSGGKVVNVQACLLEMLDPGEIPGCEIENSDASYDASDGTCSLTR